MQYFFSLFILYLAIVLAIYIYQRNLLFFPDKALNAPEEYGLINAREIFLDAEDGTKIMAWELPAKNGLPYVIYFHGNGGNLGYRAHRYSDFNERGFGIFALSYRGYGKSDGSPTEDGFYQDARASINYVKDNYPDRKIILYGESLGTGIATKMAAEFGVDAVILESPFTSIQDRAQEIYFWLPARFLVKDKFNNIDNVKKVNEPVFIIHGRNDSVIPVEHGDKVFEVSNYPKEILYTLDEHSVTWNNSALDKLENFLRLNRVL